MCRRNDHAAGAHDGLGDEGGDGVRSLGQDELFKLVGQAGREILLLLAFLAIAVEVRAVGVEIRDRRVEIAVKVRQAGQACRCDGDAVIALLPGDDLLLVRAAERCCSTRPA